MTITALKSFVGPLRWLLPTGETDAGIPGWGQPVQQGHAEPPAPRIGEPEDFLIGRGPVLIRAMGGIDMALWDIKGKARGQPIHAPMGGQVGNTVRTCRGIAGAKERLAASLLIDAISQDQSPGIRSDTGGDPNDCLLPASRSATASGRSRKAGSGHRDRRGGGGRTRGRRPERAGAGPYALFDATERTAAGAMAARVGSCVARGRRGITVPCLATDRRKPGFDQRAEPARIVGPALDGWLPRSVTVAGNSGADQAAMAALHGGAA